MAAIDITYKDYLPGSGHGSRKATQTMQKISGTVTGTGEYVLATGFPVTAANLGLAGIDSFTPTPISLNDAAAVATSAVSTTAQWVPAAAVGGLIPSGVVFLKTVDDTTGIALDNVDAEDFVFAFEAVGPSAEVGEDTR